MTIAPSRAAIVLVGGKSTRLGRDKAWEPLLGRPLLQWAVRPLDPLVDSFVFVRAAGQMLPPVGASKPIEVVEDLYPEAGPLGGIYSGLYHARTEYSVVVACDMPLLAPALVEELFRLAPDADVVLPVHESASGAPEPLCAVYSRACLRAIRQELDARRLKITSFLGAVRVRYLRPDEWRRLDPDGLSFFNVNTEEDLRRAEAILREREAAPT